MDLGSWEELQSRLDDLKSASLGENEQPRDAGESGGVPSYLPTHWFAKARKDITWTRVRICDSGSVSEMDPDNKNEMKGPSEACSSRLVPRDLVTITQETPLPQSLQSFLARLPFQSDGEFWLDEMDDISLLNKAKRLVENLTEDNWNWWPLKPRMRRLDEIQIRVNWRSVSSLKLF